MVYIVVYAAHVLEDDLVKLDREISLRMQDAAQTKLETQPEIFGKPLRHSLRNHKALRVGDFRIVYRIDGNIVRVIAMVHRKDVYRVAGMRV